MKFDVVKKGYNQLQVDEYIQKITEENQDIITQQKDAIEQLKQENRLLVEKVEGYESKKDEIFVAFVEAQETSARLKRKAEQRFEQEIERLKLFQQKWTKYAKDIVLTLSQEQAQKFEQMSKKFDEILSIYAKDIQPVSIKNTIEEQLFDDKSFQPLKKVEKFLDNFEDLPEQAVKTVDNQNSQPQTESEVAVEQKEVVLQQEQPCDDKVVTCSDEIDDVVVTQASLEIEALAEELIPVELVDDKPIKTDIKKENIQEQVEKMFAEDGHPDDGFEVMDISQSDIYNVQQSLEDLCKELGLVDDN